MEEKTPPNRTRLLMDHAYDLYAVASTLEESGPVTTTGDRHAIENVTAMCRKIADNLERLLPSNRPPTD